MKKILSVILMFVMILSIAPMTFAAEQNVSVENVNTFLFSTDVHGDLTNSIKPFYIGDMTIERSDAAISAAWEFVNQHYSSTYGVENDYMIWKHNRTNGAPSFPGSNTASVTFELDPNTSGTFTACLTFVAETSAVAYDVYLFEKPENTAKWYFSPNGDGTFSNLGSSTYRAVVASIPATARIGHFDAYGEGEIKSVYFPGVTVDADKNYYLVFAANGANEKWIPDTSTKDRSFGTLKLKSLTLSDIKNAEDLSTLIYNICETAIKSDKLANMKVIATNNSTVDNSEYTLVSWRDVYYAMSGDVV